MVEDIKLSDVIGFIGIIPFLLPEDILPIVFKWLIFLSSIIIFLIYKLCIKNAIIKKQKVANQDILDRCAKTDNKHIELSILFDKRLDTIDQLKSSIHDYNQLLQAFEYFLLAALSTKEKDKQTINNLLNIVLQYKKFMEDDIHE